MYEAIEDPYCYPGTNVLINKLEIHDADRLAAFEEEITRQRGSEPLPAGRLSPSHFRAVHRHLFQDVYSWAGQIRTVRITKGSSTFCYPENIGNELRRLFDWLKSREHLRGLSAKDFASEAAYFLGELNAIHAFRDGNGRAQLAFMALLAARADHPLDLRRLQPDRFMAAMIASFQGDPEPLTAQIHDLIL